jgi:hypothetical protein
MKTLTTLVLLVFSTAIYAADLPKTPSPAGAQVYIIGLKDGKEVKKTFTVRFGLKGMGVAPAGVDIPDTGHHHLLIDMPELPDMSMPMPASENLVHFGKGQTETQLTLKPGKHTLQLVLGDKIHLPHNPPVISKKITIVVK